MSLSTVWTTPVPDANAARAPKASSRKRNHLRRLLAPVDDGTNHLCKDVGYGRPARCTRTGRGRLGTGPPQGEGPSREPAGIRYLVPPHRGARTDPPAGGPRGPQRVLRGLDPRAPPHHAPPRPGRHSRPLPRPALLAARAGARPAPGPRAHAHGGAPHAGPGARSEERRVGKEGRSRGAPYP